MAPRLAGEELRFRGHPARVTPSVTERGKAGAQTRAVPDQCPHDLLSAPSQAVAGSSNPYQPVGPARAPYRQEREGPERAGHWPKATQHTKPSPGPLISTHIQGTCPIDTATPPAWGAPHFFPLIDEQCQACWASN